MKNTLIGGAVPEDADADLLSLLHLQGQPHAHRLRDTATYYSISAEIVRLKISDVHRTPAPVVVARIFAEKFRHHQADVRAFSDEVPVSAMMIDEKIIGTHCQTDPRRYCLLPRRKVHR